MEPDLVLFFVGFSTMLVGTGMLGKKRLSANFRGRLFTGPVRREFLLIGLGLLLVILSYFVP